MAKVEVKAPAKINIGLYVTGKRQDGYHNIETIFYPINLCDKIIIEDSDSFHFSVSDNSIGDKSTNLIVKAKNLLEEYSGEKLNYNIFLEKHIPVGAGLGGGSSDAAFVLIKLNEMAKLDLSGLELFDLALELGSDVPYFLNPKPCFAEGRGEIFHPLKIYIDLPIVIVNPGIHVPTAWAYSLIVSKPSSFNLKEITSLDSYNLRNLADKIGNDFERIVIEKYPKIKELKRLHIKMGSIFTLMSGSGSTVFGIYPDVNLASSAAKVMREENYFVYVHSPLM
jgi:4-diphosphocytidyl-2-C-methyl-D-erythritol kinase